MSKGKLRGRTFGDVIRVIPLNDGGLYCRMWYKSAFLTPGQTRALAAYLNKCADLAEASNG